MRIEQFEATDADLVKVIKQLAEVAGEKVVIHPEVEGKLITVQIPSMTFEEALTMIVSAKRYQWKKIDGVYHVGLFETPSPGETPGETPPVTRTIPLRFREARALARCFGYVDLAALQTGSSAALYRLLPPGLAEPPTPAPDGRGLLVKGAAAAVDQFQRLVQQLDQPVVQVALKFQVFAVTPEILAGFKVQWASHPGVQVNGQSEAVQYAVRDFAERLSQLQLTKEAQLLFAPAVTTDNLATARLSVGWSQTSHLATAESPPADVLPAAPLPEGWPTTLKPGQMALAVAPRVEPGHVVRLWLKCSFGLPPAGETAVPPATVTVDGVGVPPTESLALHLPPPPGEPPAHPPLLFFVTPQVLTPETEAKP